MAGYRDGSFIRILRIELITRIAPSGGTGRNTRAGIFWELPLGMRPSPKWSSPKNNKKNNGFGERDYYDAERSE
jgi:hypothetical protein